VIAAVDRAITNPTVPYGIVSFELAGDAASAQRMVDSWDETARMWAAFSLGFDYLFLVLYSTTIGLACVWAADRFARGRSLLASLGPPLAWGQWLAALLDGTENAALTHILVGGALAPWPAVARWCALPKFFLVAAGMLYAASALFAPRGRRR
jgi:hypothetical protein